MNDNAGERDLRRLNPLTGFSVFLLLLGCLLLADGSALSLDGWGAMTAGVCLFVLAMVRQAHRHTIDPEGSQNMLRQAFSGRQSVRLDFDLTGQLIHLNDLRITGALTEEEFTAAKAILLTAKSRS